MLRIDSIEKTTHKNATCITTEQTVVVTGSYAVYLSIHRYNNAGGVLRTKLAHVLKRCSVHTAYPSSR